MLRLLFLLLASVLPSLQIIIFVFEPWECLHNEDSRPFPELESGLSHLLTECRVSVSLPVVIRGELKPL